MICTFLSQTFYEESLFAIGRGADTGIGGDTLRFWERRYGFPTPARNAKGERVFGSEQIGRPQVVLRPLDQGLRPGMDVPSANELGGRTEIADFRRIDHAAGIRFAREVVGFTPSDIPSACKHCVGTIIRMAMGLNDASGWKPNPVDEWPGLLGVAQDLCQPESGYAWIIDPHDLLGRQHHAGFGYIAGHGGNWRKKHQGAKRKNQSVTRYGGDMKERGQDPPFTTFPRFSLGDALIDPPSLCIERGGISHRVEARVMQMLLVLAREPGRVVSRQDLEREVWPGRVVTDDSATNAIGKLRKALNDSPRKPWVIETIGKSGYRLKVQPTTTAEGTIPQAALADETAVRRPSLRRQALAVLLLGAVLSVIALLYWLAQEKATSRMFQGETAASVAVIPFDVLDADSSQAYFAEGITLDLISELSRIPGLLVIAPGTVFGYRETAASDREIASELGKHEEAAWETQELLAVNPDFSLSRLLLAFPLKDPHQRDALTMALSRLGLPE